MLKDIAIIFPNKNSVKKYGLEAAMLFFSVFFVIISGACYYYMRVKPEKPSLSNDNWQSFNFNSTEETTISNENDNETKESAFKSYLYQMLGNPKQILIESANINIVVNPVGLAADGSLQTPTKWNEAGWYKKSAKPGEKGNMIINAHYDDSSGKPAAFWQLKNVKVDDKVVVTDEYGRKYVYRVTNSALIDINDPNRLAIFDDPKEGEASITLITCGGVWLPGQNNYNKRLAVQGELIRQ